MNDMSKMAQRVLEKLAHIENALFLVGNVARRLGKVNDKITAVGVHEANRLSQSYAGQYDPEYDNGRVRFVRRQPVAQWYDQPKPGRGGGKQWW